MSVSGRFRLFKAIFFVMQMPIGVMLPFYWLFLKGELGLTEREITLLSGTGGISVVLFQQLWGYASDEVFSKKKLLIMNLLASAGLYMALGACRSFAQLFWMGFAFNCVYTSTNQLLHGFLFSHENSEHRFGSIRAYASMGFVLSNVVVAIVSDSVTGGKLGFIFPTVTILILLSALLIALAPERAARPHGPRLSFVEVQSHFLRKRVVAVFLAMAVLYQAPHSLGHSLLGLHIRQLGADMRVVSAAYIVAATLELPVFFAASRLINRYGALRLVLWATALQVIRWSLTFFCTTPWQVVAVSTLHSITFGLFYAAAVTFMNQHAGARLKSSAQTLFGLVYMGLASICGAYLVGMASPGGVLAGPWDKLLHGALHLPASLPLANTFLFCAVSGVPAVGLALYLTRLEPRPPRAGLPTAAQRSAA